jgi:CRISPR type III-B/RAMP module RAMP protein Cmr1
MTLHIVKLEMENLTYTIPGGFNAAPYSSELKLWERPRAQSFKGLWRWWLRTLLGGALWGSGEYDVEKVRQVTGNLLGSMNQASKFIIHISVAGETRPVDAQAIKKWRQRRSQLTTVPKMLLPWAPYLPKIPPLPPRLTLLLLAGEHDDQLAEKISCYKPGDLRITIELLKRPFIDVSHEECSVAISSLLLSLIFGGIGAITRRGFGSLSFIQVKMNKEFQEYENLVNNIVKTNDPNEVNISLHQLVKKSLFDAQKLLRVKSTTSLSEVPNCPLLSEPGNPPEDVRPFNLNVFTLSIPQVTDDEKNTFQLLGFEDYETMKLLTVIGYSTMKIFWKLIDGKEVRVPNSLWETWIMGLPRGQERKYNGKKTGYWLNDELGRRTSAISIKPIKRLKRNSWIISMYGFLSKDWNSMLYHYGIKKQKIIISPEHINKAFINAWNKLRQIYGVKQ